MARPRPARGRPRRGLRASAGARAAVSARPARRLGRRRDGRRGARAWHRAAVGRPHAQVSLAAAAGGHLSGLCLRDLAGDRPRIAAGRGPLPRREDRLFGLLQRLPAGCPAELLDQRDRHRRAARDARPRLGAAVQGGPGAAGRRRVGAGPRTARCRPGHLAAVLGDGHGAARRPLPAPPLPLGIPLDRGRRRGRPLWPVCRRPQRGRHGRRAGRGRGGLPPRGSAAMITGWLPLQHAGRDAHDPVRDDGTILGRAVRFIHQHAVRGIHVRDVAAHVRASRRWLDGQFVEHLGRTAHEEIVRVQFGQVERLLLQTDLAIEDVAARCGFRHPEYLSVAFKRRYGVSPSQWRGRRIRRSRRA
ncbi:MAG: AraC family transcriptional regulator [Planctomycetia bacterium]|nr:AraC family transcriptional regulator [Planctomycetia bacterium]